MHRYTVRGDNEAEADAVLVGLTPGRVEVKVGDEVVTVDVVQTPSGPVLRLPSGRVLKPHVAQGLRGGEVVVSWPGRSWAVARAQEEDGRGVAGLPGSRSRRVVAQMPGRVVKVLVRPGERVRVGEGLVILEAMKMENEVKARRDGAISAVRVTEGDRVETGAVLVEFE